MRTIHDFHVPWLDDYGRRATAREIFIDGRGEYQKLVCDRDIVDRRAPGRSSAQERRVRELLKRTGRLR